MVCLLIGLGSGSFLFSACQFILNGMLQFVGFSCWISSSLKHVGDALNRLLHHVFDGCKVILMGEASSVSRVL